MKIIIYLLIALVAGAILPVQAGLNAKMGKVVSDPVFAALISFVIGTMGVLFYCLVARVDFSQISEASTVNWSLWTPGFIGAFYVVTVIILVPKIGAALTFGLLVLGQMSASLVLDHYGLVGMPLHQINWQRIVGALFIISGVLLIRNF